MEPEPFNIPAAIQSLRQIAIGLLPFKDEDAAKIYAVADHLQKREWEKRHVFPERRGVHTKWWVVESDQRLVWIQQRRGVPALDTVSEDEVNLTFEELRTLLEELELE